MRKDMSTDLLIGLLLAVAALVYLTYAMLRPERF
ncbi:MAG: K(+)-transporting ATPase subunit F [Candidatus Eremiobacteraeota bacterium]|nr:K(+)-transporting ATPase subunit F [Candidatus Eremiobacteraeota bacterium]MBV9409224.1 K(+)-transporting ATPase subunit F [Candidatus Eremiobacteraeota bacterium]